MKTATGGHVPNHLARAGIVAAALLPLAAGERSAPRPAPSWKNTSWLNATHPVTLESQRGRVVLLNFWVFTCGNCTRTVPSLVRFDSLYRSQGLSIIGIHTPEFPPYAGEHDKGNVARALERYHIRYPNAQDNDYATWKLYGIRFWPSFVLINRKGQVRYEGIGEFHVGDDTDQLWERRIRELLAEESAAGPPFTLHGLTRDGIPVLALRPAAGVRINALLPPVLELGEARVLRLDRGARTADSAYFAEWPWAVVPTGLPRQAVLRASYCLDEEAVCRSVTRTVQLTDMVRRAT
jgi:thiol-disulfide isomerase/thioredoxin